jgi:hypothetical protein
MKRICLIFICLIFNRCSEVPVVIPTSDPGSGSVITQNVLIEEYTGVRCQNCPAGAQLLEELKSIHANRLIILSIHGGFFAQPANKENKLKLDNTYGQQLINTFNQPQGYPSAMIDRKIFNGQSSLFLGGGFWAGFIEQEKNKTPQVGIEVINSLDPVSRKLSSDVTVRGLSDFSAQSLLLSVALAENNIKDAQLTPSGIDTNYIHRHVMRSFLTSVSGNNMDAVMPGRKKSYNFTFMIPSEWNIDQLSVVAFVHSAGVNNEVIQAGEKSVR